MGGETLSFFSALQHLIQLRPVHGSSSRSPRTFIIVLTSKNMTRRACVGRGWWRRGGCAQGPSDVRTRYWHPVNLACRPRRSLDASTPSPRSECCHTGQALRNVWTTRSGFGHSGGPAQRRLRLGPGCSVQQSPVSSRSHVTQGARRRVTWTSQEIELGCVARGRTPSPLLPSPPHPHPSSKECGRGSVIRLYCTGRSGARSKSRDSPGDSDY